MFRKILYATFIAVFAAVSIAPAGLITQSGPRLFVPAPAEYDYYISTSGSDSNDGSLGSPWAITAINTKQATYACHSVGFLDGTYDVHAAVNAITPHLPAFNVRGCTNAGTPTIIASVNLRGAWLNAKRGSTYGGNTGGLYGDGAIIIGSYQTDQSNIVLDGFKISGSTSNPVEFGYGGSGGPVTQNIVIKNNEIFDTNGTTIPAGGNQSAITIYVGVNTQILNNYIHDIVGETAGSANHLSSIQTWETHDTTIRGNTIVNASAVYAKVGDQYGGTIEQNYIDCSSYTDPSDTNYTLFDFAGTGASGVHAGSRLIVRNNILKGGQPIGLHSGFTGKRFATEFVEIYNNTAIIATANSSNNTWLGLDTSSPGAQIYNNVFDSVVSMSYLTELGMMMVSVGPLNLIDYNLYKTGATKWSTFPNGATPYPTADYTTMALWRLSSTVAGATGAEAHSDKTITDFLYTGTGTFADLYKLQSGSPAKNAGKIGGVVGGVTCDVGAWDGVVTYIGFRAGERV